MRTVDILPTRRGSVGTVAALIGISGYVELARWGPWDRESTVLPQVYVTAVHAAGGRAVVIPPFPEHAAGLVSRLDGLILAGGNDLDPALYGAEPDPRTTGIRPARDAGEVALLRAAIEADLPTLGICRGMQLLCAHAGGKLVQHLESDEHRGRPGVYVRHPVRTVAGTRLAGILGEAVEVPSYHHQGVADAGPLTVSAYAPDGGIEAVEEPAARFRLGVLWHPEQGTDLRLFHALLAAAGQDQPVQRGHHRRGALRERRDHHGPAARGVHRRDVHLRQERHLAVPDTPPGLLDVRGDPDQRQHEGNYARGSRPSSGRHGSSPSISTGTVRQAAQRSRSSSSRCSVTARSRTTWRPVPSST